MKIFGLPEHLENYRLAYFHWFATCEGVTRIVKLLCHPDEKANLDIDEHMIDFIPATIEKETEVGGIVQKYRDWNPKFKVVFYENFGTTDWGAFVRACVDGKDYLDLYKKCYYNLS
jgi:hypothetical protein